MMRFRITLALLLCVLLGMYSSASAMTLDVEKNDYYAEVHQDYIQSAKEQGNTFSEYEYYLALKNASQWELSAAGYSDEDIDLIKSGEIEAELCAEIFRRAEMSEKNLADLGYSANEIKVLKSLSGNESLEQLSTYGILASCTIYNELDQYYYLSSQNKTYFKVAIGWEWSKCPLNRFTECVAFSWNQDYSLVDTVSADGLDCNVINLEYYHMDTEVLRASSSVGVVENNINYSYAEFNLLGGGGALVNYAKSGYAVIGLCQSGYVQNSKFHVEYAHSILGITPSPTLSSGLDFSFSGTNDVFEPAAIVNGYTPTSI